MGGKQSLHHRTTFPSMFGHSNNELSFGQGIFVDLFCFEDPITTRGVTS